MKKGAEIPHQHRRLEQIVPHVADLSGARDAEQRDGLLNDAADGDVVRVLEYVGHSLIVVVGVNPVDRDAVAYVFVRRLPEGEAALGDIRGRDAAAVCRDGRVDIYLELVGLYHVTAA